MQIDLTIEAGREVGRHYLVRMGQRFVLGRGREATIRIPDDRVSRNHCAVELTPNGLTVTDLGSSNGTLLGGIELTPHHAKLACPDDTIQVGDHVLRVTELGVSEGHRRERARTRRLDEPVLPREEFEVMGEIGRGAIGRVYAARQKLLDRTVAVKVLRRDVEVDDEMRIRFMQEGRLALRIDSPYVVEVYDLRISDGRVFLIMELVNGLSAKDRLFGGPLPIPEALRIGEQVARALDAAHRAGVVHRDIKPANILLTADGTAKLSDFGIAKDLDSPESLTNSGEGLGTLAYVSPEQATEAKQVTSATDIYSLGATLYHLIAGRPPFIPRSAKVLLQILELPPQPLELLRAETPPDVVAAIHRMLAKDANDRLGPADAVAEELRRLRKAHYPDFMPGVPEGWRLGDSGELTQQPIL